MKDEEGGCWGGLCGMKKDEAMTVDDVYDMCISNTLFLFSHFRLQPFIQLHNTSFFPPLFFVCTVLNDRFFFFSNSSIDEIVEPIEWVNMLIETMECQGAPKTTFSKEATVLEKKQRSLKKRRF